MGKVSKRVASINYMKENQAMFACPICSTQMSISDYGHVTCQQSHSFDIAKQGYVNFMTKPLNTMYSKSLFESRKEIMCSGLYDEVQQAIAKIIGDQCYTILDTGCGEGSHLDRICNQLKQEVVAVGIDISKEGIVAAAKNYEQKIWCVGDLANSPFQEKSFDVILNILSPANYDEFNRILKPGGRVIKVVPQSNYLNEVRKLAFADSEKEQYSNEQTVKRFKEQYTNVTQERVTYTIPLEENLVPKLLEMTPLGWHIESIQDIRLDEITIDLDILVGASKS